MCVTPPPKFEHQRISHRLAVALDRILVAPGHGVVVAAPVGVEFPDTEEGVQPDLLFVSNERAGIIRRGWLRGAPDLVVERFAAGATEPEVHNDRLPIRLGDETVGEIGLAEIFPAET